MTNDIYGRLTLAAGGLAGAAGVALAAAASHGGDEHLLGAASTICLAHGPALLALGLYGVPGRMLKASAGLLALGALVFAGDLITRHFTGSGLFPGAAPLGGIGMIAGWLAAVFSAFMRSK